MTTWQITRKDLKLLLRDLRTAFTLLALPLVFITIIGLTTGQLLGWRSENQLLRIALADEVDYESVERLELRLANTRMNSTWARNIVTSIIDRFQQRNGFVVRPAEDTDDAIRMVKEDEANIAVTIGPQFFERVAALEVDDVIAADEGALAKGLPSLDIHVWSEDPDSTTHEILKGFVLWDAINEINPYIFCGFDAGSAAQNNEIRRRCRSLTAEAEDPLRERKFLRKTPGENTVRYYEELIPGYVVLFAFFLVNIMARSFIEEQSLGTLRRLRVAPVRSSSILLGKTLPFLLISLIQVALLFLCGRLLFGMSWGPEPWLLIPAIVGTSLAATGLGLLVATLVENEAQVSAYATVVVIVMAGISGCFMPRDWLPDLMRDISLATPHAWALMAYDEILTEPSPDKVQVLRDCGVLVGFAAVFFAAGAWRFRKID